MNVSAVNTWAGQVAHGTIIINGKPTQVTVQNGTLQVASWLESGQPLTADQQRYLDANYHMGTDDETIGENRRIYMPGSSAPVFEVQSHRSDDLIPALTISYQAQVSDSGVASSATEALVQQVKMLNESGQNFNLLESYGAGPQQPLGY